jgi:membrane protein
MDAIDRPLRATDRFQQRWPALAFPVAVWSKFNNDQAGNLAALIAYYAFAALFPLLLVLVTVLNIFLKNDPSLRDTLLNSAVSQYPVIGPQIKASLGSIPGAGLPLIIGTILLLLGARGVARAMQNAMYSIWDIPKDQRPGFLMSQLWSLALMLTVGIGFVATTFLSSLAGGVGNLINGAAAYFGTLVVSLILNIGMFWLGFRMATAWHVRWRNLLTGAVIAAVCWQILQLAGGWVIGHLLHRSSELYGTFGIVLGLLAWLYLQAEITLYAAEADVVLARRLWPKSLLPAEPDQPAAPSEPAASDRPAAPSEPATSGQPVASGQTAAQTGGRHARPGDEASLEEQSGQNARVDAGGQAAVPRQRSEPSANDQRAAGQR